MHVKKAFDAKWGCVLSMQKWLSLREWRSVQCMWKRRWIQSGVACYVCEKGAVRENGAACNTCEKDVGCKMMLCATHAKMAQPVKMAQRAMHVKKALIGKWRCVLCVRKRRCAWKMASTLSGIMYHMVQPAKQSKVEIGEAWKVTQRANSQAMQSTKWCTFPNISELFGKYKFLQRTRKSKGDSVAVCDLRRNVKRFVLTDISLLV